LQGFSGNAGATGTFSNDGKMSVVTVVFEKMTPLPDKFGVSGNVNYVDLCFVIWRMRMRSERFNGSLVNARK
jgi:hypothetical protein